MGDKIILRTDRWHDFLSRESRGLMIAAPTDSASDRFTDEVFARLYTGDEPIAPAGMPDLRYARWALAYHRALGASPAFRRLVSDCKGNVLNTAIAIDQILSTVRPEPEQAPPPGGGGGEEGGEEGPQGQGQGQGGKGKGPQRKGGSKARGKGGAGGGEGEESESGESGGGGSKSRSGSKGPQGGGGSRGEPEKEEGEGKGGSGAAGEEKKEEPESGAGGGEPEKKEPESGEPEGKEPESAEGEEPAPGEASPGGDGAGGGDGGANSYGTGADATQGASQSLSDLLDNLPPVDSVKLERALSKAAERAEEEMDLAQEAIEGLAGAGVRLDAEGKVVPGDVKAARELARRLSRSDHLRKVCDLVGKMKPIAEHKAAGKMVGGNEETVGVECGTDVGRLLPTELARLADDDLAPGFYGDYAERRTLVFKKKSKLKGGHGPIVMVLDKSSSMQGERDRWQTAIALTMLEHARKGRRPFAVMGFAGTVQYVKMVKPGEPVPVETILRDAAGGSTNIGAALSRALEVIEAEQKKLGKLAAADIVLITDGASSTQTAQYIRERAKRLDVTIVGLAIGQGAKVLLPWTDEARGVEKLDTVDDKVAEALFTPRVRKPGAPEPAKEPAEQK